VAAVLFLSSLSAAKAAVVFSENFETECPVALNYNSFKQFNVTNGTVADRSIGA
jgi:hypothetical protein